MLHLLALLISRGEIQSDINEVISDLKITQLWSFASSNIFGLTFNVIKAITEHKEHVK